MKMSTQAYALLQNDTCECVRTGGPVIAGSLGTRDTEISRESALTPVGRFLSCENKQIETIDGNVIRQFAPVEWVRGQEMLEEERVVTELVVSRAAPR